MKRRFVTTENTAWGKPPMLTDCGRESECEKLYSLANDKSYHTVHQKKPVQFMHH